ncbi:hypothetical protein EPN96_00925 [bacterium]|nr:MAG: hypothetical protein EPN96_00925 [bacterium]
MKTRDIFIVPASAALLALAITGCSSNLDSAADETAGLQNPFGVDAEGRAFTGADKCIECHEGFTWSSKAVSEFLESKHVVHSTHVSAEEEECLTCHDPVGDGVTLEETIPAANIPEGGLAAVTCEACHGAGGEHFGVGPMPVPTPGVAICGNCHATIPDSHLPYHPEGNNILAAYQSSGHGGADELFNSAKCARCHNHEGGKLYKDVTTVEQLAGLVLPVPSASNIQCATCHDAHNPNELLKAENEDEDTGEVTASAEYNTCINCHQKDNVKLTGTQYPAAAGSTSDTGLISATGGTQLLYHAKRWGRIIATTHFDDPDTTDVIEGYVVKDASERSCRDCHDVHKGGVAINEDWAKTGHGGTVFAAKETAAAGATDRTLAQSVAVQAAGAASSWSDVDWDSADEEACQVCHTATGFSNFIKGPASYDPSLNNFSHLAGWTADDPATADVDEAVSSGQNEMLYCWGCHKNNAGGVKTSDAVILVDRDGNTFATLGTADAGESVVCVKCHGGRANGEYLKTTSAARSTSTRIHYLPAAGILYAAKTHTLFEFPSLSYTPVAYFKHDKIGLNADSPETGRGPCASCHMNDGAGHTLAAVTTEAGVITAITNQAVCDSAGCHVDPYAITAAKLEEQKTGFTAANQLLSDYLNNDVQNYIDLDIDNSTNVNDPLVTLNDYGALQNQKILASEAGAYTHNRIYAQRIIFDSIDQLDNGTFDGALDLSAYPVVAEWFQEDGDTANDNAVTRP